MSLLLPENDLDWILSQTSGFWSKHQGGRIFITGGTGFIGNWLIQTVQRANDVLGSRMELIALSRDPQSAQQRHPSVLKRSDIRMLSGDVTSFDFPQGPVDLCIHAATDISNPNKASCELDLFDSIVSGTRRVLDMSRQQGVTRFLLLSSGAVYGIQPSHLIHVPETYEGAPNACDISAAYGNGKRAAEWLTCAYAGQGHFEATIARIFALVGPGIPLNGPFAAGNFIRDAIARAPIVIEGDGRTIRSYLYMADLCVWLFRLLESGQSGEAYNIGSENPLSILDLAEEVNRVSGSTGPIEVRRPSKPNTAPPRYVPNTSKARQLLQLQEYTTLHRALHNTVEWVRLARNS